MRITLEPIRKIAHPGKGTLRSRQGASEDYSGAK